MRVPRRFARVGAAADLPNAMAFDAYVGPSGEITVDHLRGIIALHDGVTAGGKQYKIADLLPEGGTEGQVPARASDGSVEWVNQSGGSSAAYTPETLVGMTLSNSPGDLEHDILISPGYRRDVANAENIDLEAGLVKQIDAAWAAGNNAGGLDTGTVAANTTYFLHAIKNTSSGVVDVLFSASPTSPSMPAGFTARRRLGAVLTDASANICQFLQTNGWFYYLDAIEDSVGSVGSTAASVTLSRIPLGIKVRADLSLLCSGGTASVLSVCDQDLGDATVNDCIGVFDSSSSIFNIKTLTDNARRINVRASGGGTMYVYTRGWYDERQG